MPAMHSKVIKRLSEGIKQFQPILESAKSRDINKNDTATIITDILNYVFGYDKYSEITSEYCIRNTYCDLAIKLQGEIQFIIEVKAIGLELKENFVKQAVDYAANLGAEWVVLTNGTLWRIYKVCFTNPINSEMIAEIDFLQINPKDQSQLELLFMLAKEGWQKSMISELHAQKKALDKFLIAALLSSERVLEVFRRELKRINSSVKIKSELIKNVLINEVLKAKF